MENMNEVVQVIILICLLLYFIFYLTTVRLSGSKNNLLNAISFILIFIFLIIIYSFKEDFSYIKNKILSNIFPSYEYKNKNEEIILRRNLDDHFYINGYFSKNTKINFLIDTGASSTSLNLSDARKLRINIDKLKFNRPVYTANGKSFVAKYIIDKISVGGLIFYNKEISIMKNNSNHSLLGMDIIGRFDSITIDNDIMILKK